VLHHPETPPLSSLVVFLLVLLVVFIGTFRAAWRWSSNGGRLPGGEGEHDPVGRGLAIAGTYMSAASVLGICGLTLFQGFDALIYAVGWIVGWPLFTCLFLDRIGRLGERGLVRLICCRFAQRRLRLLAAASAVASVTLYLAAQMVGAGTVIQRLFGLPYAAAVVVVGGLAIIYISFGGASGAHKLQVIKSGILLITVSLMAGFILLARDFSPQTLLSDAIAYHPAGEAILGPGLSGNDLLSTLSIGLALMLGMPVLPHLLIRVYADPELPRIRHAVWWATGFLGFFYLMTFIIGFGAIALVLDPADLHFLHIPPLPGSLEFDLRQVIGGTNLAALHAAEAIGGPLFAGFFAAIVIATILGVLAGLIHAAAAALVHDLGAALFNRLQQAEPIEARATRLAIVLVTLVSIELGILFENQNVAVLVGLAFAIAASSSFPVLFLSFYWPGMTGRGAVVGGCIGLICSVGLITAGPVIWCGVFGFAHPLIPLTNPALLSIGLAFLGIWLFSVTDSRSAEKARAMFETFRLRLETGIEIRPDFLDQQQKLLQKSGGRESSEGYKA
jgi:cation/acetate symporter